VIFKPKKRSKQAVRTLVLFQDLHFRNSKRPARSRSRRPGVGKRGNRSLGQDAGPGTDLLTVRVGLPDDAAKSYLYAIQNPYVTGQIIIVDGGGSLT
jgi:NAD(P)-dependent dehydrogenase (short-subunit alcohol dehydrogenase family)